MHGGPLVPSRKAPALSPHLVNQTCSPGPTVYLAHGASNWTVVSRDPQSLAPWILQTTRTRPGWTNSHLHMSHHQGVAGEGCLGAGTQATPHGLRLQLCTARPWASHLAALDLQSTVSDLLVSAEIEALKASSGVGGVGWTVSNGRGPAS